ncbi:MAG: hypothetical protein N2712_03255 [Brevinematales bacterium]|nr:hypothetical protein [Brevinematales bacterium]
MKNKNFNDHSKKERRKLLNQKNKFVKSYVSFSVDTSVVIGVCPICGENCYKDPSNIVISDHTFHFDCVVNFIKSNIRIDEDKKLYYTGSNTFGIVWESKTSRRVELIKRLDLREILKEYVSENI